ncbi:rhodanese-like domain-containing protein [Streptosporangium amethystogenes subsp. fukuiense]|uniref:Rhodanese-like domain-containing protein n=1 Tax=Streptosporangium amethystogenes subsp. fukuiense TaxID=698418 RepID=A0ABW2T5B3_9ACTN
MSTSSRHLVANARDRIRNMSVAEVAEALETGAVTLVDLREPDEVQREGAIPDAVQAPRGMLEFWADPAGPYHRAEFDPLVRTILYCASGGRSALAAQTLQELGYTDVSHLDGGLAAWKDQGRPVTFQTPPSPPGDREDP